MPSDAQPTTVSNAQWDPRSVGKRWQFAFFGWLIRHGGRRLAYLCMYVVAAWYVLLSPFVRRRCRHYLNRRFPHTRNPIVRLWHDYRRIESLGESLIDRAAFGLIGPGSLHVDFPDGLRLRELIAEGRGLIILNSHVGCWQVALSALSWLNVPVSVVMHSAAGDIDPRWFAAWGGKVPFSIIDPVQPMGGIMEMIGVLQRGEVLGLMADRVLGDDPNTLAADFIGAPVQFPVSAYRLASMRGTPIVVVLSHKTGWSTYRIELPAVIRVPSGLGRSNAAYTPYLRQFVDSLDAHSRNHPWQFFNFHNMWQE